MIIYKKLLNIVNERKKKLINESRNKLKEFEKVIDSSFRQDLLNIWYINKPYIKIGFALPFHDYIGYTNLASRTIKIKSINKLASIYHEFFHLASTIVKEDIIKSGFAIYKETGSLGVGLTEGYTEILTCRYFGKKNKNVKGYFLEKHYLLLLEKIIGRKKMEELYLTANLEALISELTKYDELKNIIEFIQTLDKICENDYKKLSIDTVVHLNRLLFTWYNKKISKLNISKELKLKKLEKFLYRLNYYDKETILEVDAIFNEKMKTL